MKTLADLKRRILPGTRLRCLRNTSRPTLDGGEREVVRVQGNAFTWVLLGQKTAQTESWTYYPKAKGLWWIDDNTFEMQLSEHRPEHTVRLEFISGTPDGYPSALG